MCAIIGWSGKLPTDLLKHLLTLSEARGADSTGLAWHDGKETSLYKQSVAAKALIDKSSDVVKNASGATAGIAHTRKASKGMPINSANAHPFVHGKIVYAHNGKVDNWETLKTHLTSSKIIDHPVTTDSMVLGHYIENLDLSDVIGCMALVWMLKGKVYTTRTAKEAAASVIQWKDGKDLVTTTIVTSTPAILKKAIAEVDAVVAFKSEDYDENIVYSLHPKGLKKEADIKTNPRNHEDKFTSSTVSTISNAYSNYRGSNTAWSGL